jgi:hypothetical protein
MTMRYAHLAPGSGADLMKALETPTSVAAGWQQRQTAETKLSDISKLDGDPNGMATERHPPAQAKGKNPVLLLCEVKDL